MTVESSASQNERAKIGRQPGRQLKFDRVKPPFRGPEGVEHDEKDGRDDKDRHPYAVGVGK